MLLFLLSLLLLLLWTG